MSSPASPPLVIIADLTAKEGQEAALRAALEKAVEPSRKDAGCEQYTLHVDVKDGQAGHFVFYEIWSTRELWQAHMGTEHVKALLVAAEQFADKVVVHELAHVGSPQ